MSDDDEPWYAKPTNHGPTERYDTWYCYRCADEAVRNRSDSGHLCPNCGYQQQFTKSKEDAEQYDSIEERLRSEGVSSGG